jgi:D-beta-D-heptose 7-phosphate kinase/D-beta-D-heptose 1-phosphate adenosyltransferase
VLIGLANGCFDGLHKGHKHFLSQCHKHCDHLIVALNSDASVARLKGPSRPIQTLTRRLDMLRTYVEAVIPFEGRIDPLIMEMRPDVYFVGYDHNASDLFIRKPGWKESGEWDKVKVIQISHLPGYSTTGLLHATE